MATINITRPQATPAAVTYAACAGGGDHFLNTGREMVHIKNGSGAPITVTFDAPNADNFGVTDNSHDLVVSIPATSDRLIGPFRTDRFNITDGGVNDGKVAMTYSGVTSLTVAVLSVA